MREFGLYCHRVIGTVCAALLLILGMLVFYQAATRYVTALPTALWTEEIARGLLIWLVMIGAGWAAFENTHFRLSALQKPLGRFYGWIGCCATTAGGAYMIYSAIPFSARGLMRVSQVTGLLATWAYSAVFVGGLLILLGGILQGWRLTTSSVVEKP